jgi:hypothetical protein
LELTKGQKSLLIEEYGQTITCGLLPQLRDIAVLCNERHELVGVRAEEAFNYLATKKHQQLSSERKTKAWVKTGCFNVNAWEMETTLSAGSRRRFSIYETDIIKKRYKKPQQASDEGHGDASHPEGQI